MDFGAVKANSLACTVTTAGLNVGAGAAPTLAASRRDSARYMGSSPERFEGA
jgi:hypothetical protein